jgi:hypothetical protein
MTFRRWGSAALLMVGVLSASQSSAQITVGASLSGIVRDSTGTPVRDAEVTLRNGNRGTRTNERGEFTLSDVTPGAYDVWFRRLGYRSVEYNWAAHAGEKTQVTVVLHQLPRQLDPVVVRADEDRKAATQGSILGLVIDENGTALPEAEVQLVGAKASGVTRANGGFLFKPLAVGTYLLRVRKLGYSPVMVTTQLVDRDDREVVIRMSSLAQNLEPAVVTAQSGYGPDEGVFDDLEKRKSWSNLRNRIFGPEDLRALHGLPLTMMTTQAGFRPDPITEGAVPNDPALGISPRRIPTGRAKFQPRQIDPTATSSRPSLKADPEDVCMLLNGREPLVRPLRVYTTDDVDLLEVYPEGTEMTGTVSARFKGYPGCEGTSIVDHPTYYVLWLKNRG